MTDIKKGLEKDTDINKKLVSLNSIYDTLNKSLLNLFNEYIKGFN